MITPWTFLHFIPWRSCKLTLVVVVFQNVNFRCKITLRDVLFVAVFSDKTVLFVHTEDSYYCFIHFSDYFESKMTSILILNKYRQQRILKYIYWFLISGLTTATLFFIFLRVALVITSTGCCISITCSNCLGSRTRRQNSWRISLRNQY